MKCPRCATDLGEGLLPARCPSCGANLRDRAVEQGGTTPAAARRSIEGLTGIGHGSPRKNRHWGRIVLALVLVGLFCAGLVWGGDLIAQASHRVPDFVGWRYERAESELEALGYTVERTDVATAETEAGIVVEADVPAGPGGGPARLTVAQERVMPDVVGKTAQEAEDALDALDIAWEVEERVAEGTVGTVIETSMEAGATVVGDPTVTLVVAKSPTVPDVMGLDRSVAQRKVEEAGLTAELVAVAATDGAKSGTVVSIDPAPGAAAAYGSKVKLGVASDRRAQAQATAEQVLAAVYGTTPNGDSIGEALLPLLSPQSPYAGKTAHEVWYGMVKGGGRHQGVDQAIQALPRTITSSSVEVSPDGSSATATVGVSWEWTPMGSMYQGVTSNDTHQVTMTFDDEGRLLTFSDPQTDVPAYQVVEETRQAG